MKSLLKVGLMLPLIVLSFANCRSSHYGYDYRPLPPVIGNPIERVYGEIRKGDEVAFYQVRIHDSREIRVDIMLPEKKEVYEMYEAKKPLRTDQNADLEYFAVELGGTQFQAAVDIHGGHLVHFLELEKDSKNGDYITLALDPNNADAKAAYEAYDWVRK